MTPPEGSKPEPTPCPNPASEQPKAQPGAEAKTQGGAEPAAGPAAEPKSQPEARPQAGVEAQPQVSPAQASPSPQQEATKAATGASGAGGAAGAGAKGAPSEGSGDGSKETAVGSPGQSRKRVREGTDEQGDAENGETASPKRHETEDAVQAARRNSAPVVVKEPVTLETKYSGPKSTDSKRQWCREILFKSFVSGLVEENQRSMLDGRTLSFLVYDIEVAQWDYHVKEKKNSNDYNNQCRSISSNFRDQKNPELNIRVYMGAITPEDLCKMSSLEMASDAKKRERRKAQKDALEACQSDWDLRNIKRAAGQFPCGKCKSNDTTYFQMQTRSSDEPMTTYVTCINCGNRWKF